MPPKSARNRSHEPGARRAEASPSCKLPGSSQHLSKPLYTFRSSCGVECPHTVRADKVTSLTFDVPFLELLKRQALLLNTCLRCG
jgi:hypothetical protein